MVKFILLEDDINSVRLWENFLSRMDPDTSVEVFPSVSALRSKYVDATALEAACDLLICDIFLPGLLLAQFISCRRIHVPWGVLMFTK